MSDLILAIDQGTSSTKTVLFDENARIIAKGDALSETLYPRPGFVEQDPEGIYENTLLSVRSCMDRAGEVIPDAKDRVAAIGISNQRESFVLWDEKGVPLCNAVIWQCKRAIPICERLKGSPIEDEIRTRTGLILDPYFSGAKLAWMMENHSGLKDAAGSGKSFFGTIDTWLLYKFTRGRSYLTDYTNASRTLLFNIHTLGWDQTLMKAFGANGLRMPGVVSSSFDFGASNLEGIFPKPIPICGMIGDSHAAAFGQGCFKPGQAKATLGTGSSILCNTGASAPVSDHGMVTTICWSTQERVDYALEGIIVSCGSTIKWLRDQLGLFSSSAETETMVRGLDSSGGVYLIPAFSGMGAPHWKMDARASIVGLTFGTGRRHIVRAALESVIFQIKDVILAMEKDSGVKLSQLKVDGGMSANNWLLQMMADLLGVRVTTVGIQEVSALGAAYMAGLGIGIFQEIAALSKLRGNGKYFDPSPASGSLLDSYETWQSMLEKHC
ncbi:MAG: glycerol kinase GlpK [Desulfobacteraceae bacterium]|nr:MAG: glycerol kinase GlpK [Desulfobacteraceae bacterium]